MNEEPYADQMAEQLNSLHKKVFVSPEVEKLLPKLIWHMDEPIGDPAAISSYLVSKAARETLTVLLSGVGGDEVFGGYPRYLAMKLLMQYNKIPKLARFMISSFVKYLPGGGNALFRNMIKFIKASENNGTNSYFDMLSYFNMTEQRRLFTPDFYSEVKDTDVFYFHKMHYKKSDSLSWLNQLQYIDFKTFLPCLNLMYTDKMSMAASIEVRVPYLDHHFVEEMFRIPCRYKLNGLKRKYALKKSMEGLLPHEVIWRKKFGFGAPIHSWIRGELREMIEDYLSESTLKSQGIFDYKYIRRILDLEYANKYYYSNHIWQLLVFQIWHDQFLK